jgi:hypothetical protein
MNMVKFILTEEEIIQLKKVIKINSFNKNLIIHTDNNKNIIITLSGKYSFFSKVTNSFSLKTDYKSKIDFNVTKSKVVYKINKKKHIEILSPIVIPPIDEYEITLFLKENYLEMKSIRMKFEFPFDEIPLTSQQNHLPN